MGNVKDSLLWRWRKIIVLLVASQASPSRPSRKSSVKVKTEWLEMVAGERGRREFFISSITVNYSQIRITSDGKHGISDTTYNWLASFI
jgi:hypothetical protein